jgi:hypothetical protein
MSAERVSMRRVREMMRYRSEQGLGYKAISLRVGVEAITTGTATMTRKMFHMRLHAIRSS